MNPGAAGAVAAAVAVPIVLRVLARRFPANLSKREQARSLDELSRIYGRWESLGLVALIIAPASGLVCWWLLCRLANWRFGAFAHAPYALVPTDAFWILPAEFIGILSAWRPLDVLYRVLLKERYAEFLAYQKLKYGIDQQRLEYPLYAITGGLCLAYVTLVLDWYALFTPAGITVNPFWTVGALQYSYGQVRSIRASDRFVGPTGKIVPQWSFVIDFDDGRRWGSRWSPARRDPARLREIAAYVARESGRPIETRPLLKSEDQ